MSDTYAKVFEIEWTEYERGWGQRPDGYTYHPTEQIAQKYIDDYWAHMPKEVPDYFSWSSDIKPVFVNQVFAMLVEGKGTVHSDKRIKE